MVRLLNGCYMRKNGGIVGSWRERTVKMYCRRYIPSSKLSSFARKPASSPLVKLICGYSDDTCNGGGLARVNVALLWIYLQ